MTATQPAPKSVTKQDESAVTASAGKIATDDAFHLLQNSRRRAVMRYLLEYEDTERFRMRDVAEEVAAWEHDTTVELLDSAERSRVYIALYQSHLPKLDEHGVIEYDQDRGVVEPTRLLSLFDTYLEEGLDADSDHLVCEPEFAENGSGITSGVLTLFGQ